MSTNHAERTEDGVGSDATFVAPGRDLRSSPVRSPSGHEEPLAFYAFPAEGWVYLTTTNPIESTFATVRLHTKVTKGPSSRAAGLAVAYKLIEQAQTGWRTVNAPHLVAMVRAGVTFEEGRAN